MPQPQDIEAKIRAAAVAKNVDPDLALRIAQAESSGQSGAQNPRSTAQGLFQVIDDTWKRYGGKPGKKFDVDENIRVGTDILADNTNKLRQILGRDPQGHEVYTAHFFGPGTAKHVLTADANRPLNEILSQKVLNANPELKNQTTGEFLQRMQSKTGSKPAAATASRPAAPDSGPTASEKMMTDALKSGMSAQNLMQEAGPGYKAAMAMMFLAEDKPEKDDEDIWKEAEAPVQEETAQPDVFAGLDLGYQSPFPVEKPPVRMASGGSLTAALKAQDREFLNQIKAYQTAAQAYQPLAQQYYGVLRDANGYPVIGIQAAAGPNDVQRVGIYNTNVANALQDMTGIEGLEQGTYQLAGPVWAENALRGTAMRTDDPRYAEAVAWAKARGSDTPVYFQQNVQTLDPTGRIAYMMPYSYDSGKTWGSRMDTPTAPTMPVGASGTAMTVDEAMARAEAIKKAQVGKQIALDVAQNPEEYNLSMSGFMAKGGIVHRADGSPETGELSQAEIDAASRPAFVTPKSGLNRQQGPISQALNSGEAYPAIMRGVGDVAYDIVGGPVDIANLVIKASPMISKYAPEKPVLGSDWIKEKMTAAGIRPADETDPTLKGFRTVGELGASLVNPTAPVRSAVQTSEKAADMLRRMVEPNTEARAAAAKASLQEMRPVELNLDQALAASRAREQQSSILPIQPPAKKTPELTSVQPPVQMALPLQEATPAKKGKPVAGPIYSHLPSDEAPFVGRLDEYMANLPGPVQKQQLLNQLKGKFRDYEIGRAEEAFKDLEANAKLTPSDALNRIKSVYDPGKYKTTVLPPNPEDPTANWRSKDNVYFNESTDQGQHLGVIHLTENLPPEVLQRKVEAAEARNAVRVLTKSSMYAGNYTDEMNQLDNFLKNSSIRPSPELQQKLQTGISQYRGIRDYERDVEIAHDRLLYPNIAPGYMDERNMLVDKFLAENPGMMYSEAVTKAEPIATDSMAKQGNSWLVANGYPPVKVPNFFEVGPNPHVYAMNTPEIKNSIKAAFEPAREKVLELDQNLNKHMKGVERRFQAEYADDLPYMGQHATMGGGPSPISFSRYSEHTAQIPGLGKVDGIYVNELQSDLLDDLRKNGPKGRNKPLDTKEAEAIQANLISLNSQRDEAYKSGNNKLAEQLDNQILSAEGRLKTLSVRLNPARAEPPDYALKEVFHKMETSGAVAQQLMAKNAIIGAIQQGKRFVAFPGAESDQSQLYEKLPRVLKDVVKDLGPGFEMRDVTLSNQDGNKFSHNAVVWGPEAAARIQKKGVPFATGGSVDKANIDHRKYM